MNHDTDVIFNNQQQGDIISIVLFDAHCLLCTRTVTFLMKRDRQDLLTFISMHSQEGRTLMEKHGVTLEMNTFVFIKGSSCLIRSDAAIGIISLLGGWWSFFRFFSMIPRPIRDGCYTFVASHRYQWFGRDQYHCESVDRSFKPRDKR